MSAMSMSPKNSRDNLTPQGSASQQPNVTLPQPQQQVDNRNNRTSFAPQTQSPLASQSSLGYQSGSPQPGQTNGMEQGAPPARPRPQANTTANNHSRTSSFFSSFRKGQSQTPSQAGNNRPATVAQAGGRPANGGLGSVSEFGGVQQPAQQQPPPPQGQRQPPQQRASMYEGSANGPASKPPTRQASLALPSTSRQNSDVPSVGAGPQLHPEIRSVVSLTLAHARKVYFSGPLVRRIERQADGMRPTKDEGWNDVWAQLGGTTLSLWDMKAIAEASKEGREVPPTYVNMTDAFINVMGKVTTPSSASAPAQQYMDVFALNTAGSNLLLFSCPNTASLMSWVGALRLSAWEKSRLEEIYTAHLLRISIPDAKEMPSELVKGRLDGWVRVRLAGQTDWKRFFMVVSSGASSQQQNGVTMTRTRTSSISEKRSESPSTSRNKRISNLFSREPGPGSSSSDSLPPKPVLNFYLGNKAKERKAPVLALRAVTQAFAVYPERPELISKSTLVKLEGLLGDEVTAGGMRNKEAWIMVMPELEGGNSNAKEVLKWVMAFHDAFELYGRPKSYSWDPRDPRSLMFAYPVGASKDLLFLDREAAETMDPRDDRTPVVRAGLLNILYDKMQGASGHAPPAQQSVQGSPGNPRTSGLPGRTSSDGPPSLPPIPSVYGNDSEVQNGQPQAEKAAPQLPNFNFDSDPRNQQNRGALTPITERTMESFDHRGSRSMSSDKMNPGHSLSGDQSVNAARQSLQGGPSTVPEEEGEVSMFGLPISKSPPPSLESPPLPGLPEESHIADSSSVGLSSVGKPITNATSSVPSTATSVTGDSASTRSPHPPSKIPLSSGRSIGTASPAPSASKASLEKPQGKAEPPRSSSPSFSVLTSPFSMMGREPNSRAIEEQIDEPPSPKVSILTSPFSMMHDGDRRTPSPNHFPLPNDPRDAPVRSASPPGAYMKSPHSPTQSVSSRKLPALGTITNQSGSAGPSTSVSSSTDHNSLFDETAALYYMQQFEDNGTPKQPATATPARRIPTTISEGEDDSTEDSTPNQSPRGRSLALPVNPTHSQPMRRGTPGLLDMQITEVGSATSPGVGQYNDSPITSAGARAETTSRNGTFDQKHDSEAVKPPAPAYPNTMSASPETSKALDTHDDNADAMAALSFLDQGQSPPKPRTGPIATPSSPPLPPQIVQPPETAENSDASNQYRSSFAPSKSAAERKAKLQAQEAASYAAAHKPGRANCGNKRKNTIAGGWAQSSDEEEDDDDDDDADSDEAPTRAPPALHAPIPTPPPVQPLQVRGRQSPSATSPLSQSGNFPTPRQPRTLPPVPGSRQNTMEPSGYYNTSQQRGPSGQYAESQNRSYYDQGPTAPPSQQQQQYNPGAAHQDMWSRVLEPGQNPADLTKNRDTFVQIEAPAQTMTKAFAPQGLLSAGLQDKQDRSAKKQEELARESGTSLINVPNKPQAPQTGLLGAVAAHERERNREGGVGAALTERERDRRMVENQQRKLDEMQRHQLDMVQNGGGQMYQQPQFTGFNPMMNPMMMGMNPMMTGMNPMMTGMMGHPNMMPGFANPQHMFAAQQAAAQAYQQAMIAYSTAGSQIGGGEGGQKAEGVDGAPPTMGAMNSMNPMMTGGAMSMFDPRMSMMGMGMPMMGSPYGMGGQQGMQGMQPSMGGYPGMPGMGMMGAMGMSPQITGGSGFDPRFSPGNENGSGTNNGLQPPGPFQGQAAQGPSSRGSSPAGRGSPAKGMGGPASGQSSPRPPVQ